MPYVSAQYLPPDPMMPPDSPKQVAAVDHDGQRWVMTEESQVGDWVDYIANGGTIDPAIIPNPTPEQVDAERDRRIDSGFLFQGIAYQSRTFDRDNISGATQAANMAVQGGAQAGDYRWQSPDYDFVWIAADNSLTPMDAPTVVEFGQTLMGHKQNHIFYARSLKDSDPIPMNFTDDIYWPAGPELVQLSRQTTAKPASTKSTRKKKAK